LNPLVSLSDEAEVMLAQQTRDLHAIVELAHTEISSITL
jgi:hypothetical protein